MGREPHGTRGGRVLPHGSQQVVRLGAPDVAHGVSFCEHPSGIKHLDVGGTAPSEVSSRTVVGDEEALADTCSLKGTDGLRFAKVLQGCGPVPAQPTTDQVDFMIAGLVQAEGYAWTSRRPD